MTGKLLLRMLTDINHSYHTFFQRFTDAYNESCPVIKVKQNEVNHKPWLTPGFANACTKKIICTCLLLNIELRKQKISINNIKIN